MMRLIFATCLLLVSGLVVAQNDFRSRQSGPWSTPATWEEFIGGSWQLTGNTPGISSGAITVRSPHVVTVTQNVAADELTVASGGSLTISIGIVLTIANGTGTDLTNSGSVNTTSEPQLIFSQDSEYIHARNGGTIPLATWNTNSTCNITGVTATVPAGLSPSGGFFHFLWNGAAQSGTIRFDGNLNDINGNLTIQSTNGQTLQLSTVTITNPVNIDGDLTITGNSKVSFTTSATITVNVGGDFNYFSTSPTGSLLKNTGVITMNITGDLNINAPGGLINFASGANPTTVNLNGNFDVITGTVTETATGFCTINFIRNGIQSFSNTGSIQNTFNYTIASGSTLDVLAESPLTGTGTLTVSGALRVGSANNMGAIESGTTAGNVRVTSRVYNSGSRIIYGGTTAQFIGDGHPATAGVITEIDNANGVSFDTNTLGNSSASVLLIPADLILSQGNLNIISTGTARSLTLGEDVIANANSISFAGPNSSLTINGSGAFGIFPLPATPQTLLNFTMARTTGSVSFNSDLTVTGTTTLSSGDVDINTSATLIGPLSLANGTTLFFEGALLTLQGSFTSAGGFLSANSASTLTLSGTMALANQLTFSPTGNTLNTLILNKSNVGTSLTVSTPLTISNALTLTDGQLDIVNNNLALVNGATISRNANASISVSSPSGGPWNVIYSGGNLTTGLEIPVTGVILLTSNINSANTVTLNQALIATGGLVNATPGGIFNSGNNSVTLGSFTNSGTFTAPSASAATGLTVSGAFVNNSIYNHSAGTLFLNGAVTMSGSSITTTNFHNITLNGGSTLTAPAMLIMAGSFTNNGSFVAGGGSVQFNGGTGGAKTISGTSNSQFFNLILNKTNSGISLNVASQQNVTNSLTLTDGQLDIASGNLVLSNGATLTRSNLASISNTSPGGGPWNLIYVNNSQSTGLEIPANFTVQSLTVNSNTNAVVTLTTDLISNGAITINAATTGPTFTSGAHNVTAVSLTNNAIFNSPLTTRNLTLSTLLNAGTFNALTGTILLAGNFTNNGTFNRGTSTVTFNGTSSVLGSVNPTFNHVAIAASSTLNSPATLSLAGNFTITGTFLPGTGTVSFAGSTTQNISGALTTFNNLSVTNTFNPGVRVQSNQNLRGVLTLGPNATFDADGSGNTAVFTVLSVNDIAGSDASIAAIPATASVLGSVSVQRYWRAVDDRSRFISTPVVNPPVSQIQASGIPVTGQFTGASTCTGCNGGNNLKYNDETLPGTLLDGYIGIPDDNQTNAVPLLPGVGYALYMWEGQAPSLLSLRGQVNQGSIPLPVTFTNNGVPDADGWNLVGNPYPSSIRWANPNLGGWTMANIETTVWVWNVVTRVWRSFNYATGTGTLPGGVIATGQAFWVEATGVGVPSITVHETAKVTPGGAYLRTKEKETDGLVVAFSVNDITDNAFITLDDRGTRSFEKGLDHRKLELGIERLSVALVADEKKLVQYTTSKNDLEGEIALAITATEGDYELAFSTTGDGSPFDDFYLVDLQKNSFRPVTEKYHFSISENPLSREKRFYLTKSPEALLKNSERPFVSYYPNPVNGTLHINVNSNTISEAALLNNMGQKIKEIELVGGENNASGVVDMHSVPAGFYFIRVRDENNKAHIHKIIKN